MTQLAGRAARLGLFALLAAGLTAMAGCSAAKADAAGKVTYKGKPVTSGTVIMIGPDNQAAYGTISAEGTYSIAGVAPGAVKVGVSSPDPSAAAGPPADGGRGKPAPKAKAPPPKDWMPLPLKYATPDDSKLTATLKPGANSHDITIAD